MLTYTTWINSIKLQRAFGDVLTRDPSGTMEEQMRAEALGEEAITRRDNFPVRQNMTDYFEKKY